MGKKGLIILGLLFGLATANLPVSAAVSAESEEVDFSADEIIIKFKNKKKSANIDQYLETKLAGKFATSLISANATQRLRTVRHRKLNSDISLVKLNKAIDKKQLRALIATINAVKYSDTELEIEAAYPNYIYKGTAEETGTTTTAMTALTTVYDNYEWATEMGEGAVVAVIDSGVNYNHPDLAKNIWQNEDEIPNNGKDDDKNGFIDDVRGWDFVKKAGSVCAIGEDCSGTDNDPMDFDGHGSHVAGIIAAVHDNNIGVSGVAPKAKIMPVRAAYSDGHSTYLKTSDIYNAIAYAIDNKADVINMSFCGVELDVLRDILEVANDMGIVLVAAAGNRNVPYLQYPAALPFVIAVGAVDANNEKASFSNYGSWIDIAAPGVDILSTSGTRKNYEIRSGTSMAAPYVAGIAALVKAKNKVHSLSADDIRARIISSATASDFVPVLSPNLETPVEVDEVEFDDVVAVGEKVIFDAKATGASAFKWRSNVDGELSSNSKFSADNLSVGTHMISVSVADDSGNWSKPVSKVLRVVDSTHVAEIATATVALDIVRVRETLVAKVSKAASKRIAHYLWESTIDGSLDDGKAVSISALSPGFHKIILSIQDLDGNISTAVEQVIQVQ